MKLAQASSLWAMRLGLRIEVHTVAYAPLRAFSFLCRDFLGLGESALSEDYFWRQYCGFIRRLRFDLAASPTSLRAASSGAIHGLEEYRHGVEKRRRAYPQMADAATDLLDSAATLVESSDAPLLKHLFYTDLLRSSRENGLGIVVPESRYLGPLRRELESLEVDAVPLAPRRLGGYETYERLIFSGPTAWFPDSVVTSPRSSELAFVHFDWVGPDSPPRPLLPGRDSAGWGQGALPAPVHKTPAGGAAAHSTLVIADIVPTIDWDMLQTDVYPAGAGEDVSAVATGRLCLLEGGLAAFLWGHEEGRVFVMTFDHGKTAVGDTLVSELTPGDYVLLRTEGGGDYMVELAWRILGGKAKAVQGAQDHWKTALARLLRELGVEALSLVLQRHGAAAASPQNVKAWCTAERIQPGTLDDFRAVMLVLGLEAHADEYWRLGRHLIRARIRAGHRIRTLLLEQAGACDFAVLHERGRADFRLEDGGGGISAFRVMGLAPGTVEVPAYRIQVPFQLGGAQWPG